MRSFFVSHLTISTIILLITSCSGSREASSVRKTVDTAELTPQSLTKKLFGDQKKLKAVEGKAKALISQPGNTDRATVIFQSNEDSALIKVKNRIGIDGGLLFLTPDSVLLYNKIDKYVRITHRESGSLPELNGIEAINILKLLDYRFSAGDIQTLKNTDKGIRVVLKSGTQLQIDPSTGHIEHIQEPLNTSLPYSSVDFEAFSNVGDYRLPRKITILSNNRRASLVLLISDIHINPADLKLNPDIPDNITRKRL